MQNLPAMDLDCGIAYRRIAAWLDDELALPRNDEGAWEFTCEEGFCTVTLTECEPRMAGPISLERTRLQADGDDAALERFNRLFTLRFVSAGG